MRDLCQPAHDQVGTEPLKERNNQPGGVLAVRLHPHQDQRHHSARRKLQQQLLPAGETQVPPMHHLDVVVRESDCAERQR